MLTAQQLMQLDPDRFRMDDFTPIVALEWFAALQAGWVHNGDHNKPHAILHSGLHSDGFFLCKRVLGFANLREILAGAIVVRLARANMDHNIGGVFGSPYSSILLAAEVARILRVKVYVPEKDPTDPAGKCMIFKSDDPIPEGARLLQIEELVTTFDSGEATANAIVGGNPCPVAFMPFVGVLVHRPKIINRTLADRREIVPFIEKQVSAWPADDCPLCKAGSPAVFPKKDWAKLTA